MSPRDIGRALEALAYGKTGGKHAFDIAKRVDGGSTVARPVTRAEVAQKVLAWIGAAR